MILYMVELELSDKALRIDWEAWHEEHAAKLTCVPGFRSAQRFRLLDQAVTAYLALYEIDSLDVLTSQAYLSSGSPPSAADWHARLQNWHRNVAVSSCDFRAPRIGARLLVVDRVMAASTELPAEFIRFRPIALDQSFTERGIRILDDVAEAEMERTQGVGWTKRRFEAISQQIKAPQKKGTTSLDGPLSDRVARSA